MVFDLELLDRRVGFALLAVSGRGAEAFHAEAGGHRWQRVPPNERRGRVHTSTVTVAVLELRPGSVSLDPRDVEFTTTVGSGPGGQHRNKTASAVVAVHTPTGERVRVETERSQHRNKATALEILAARLGDREADVRATRVNERRRAQVGSGERGDKVRTYRVRDDRVVDHRTGERWSLARWMAGDV